MKKLLTIFFIIISMSMFAQNKKYSYKIQLLGVTDSVSASGVMEILESVFQVKTPYNKSTGCFEFNTHLSMNETGFEYHMKDEGYNVILYEKKEFTYEIIEHDK